MTTLENTIRIKATPQQVWQALGQLDALEKYDSGVKKSTLLDGPKEGMGATRQCDLTPGGWFRERVTDWKPGATLAFELTACTLPVKALRHSYRFEVDGAETIVTQKMEYQLKFGPLGALMDVLMVRIQWNSGIKSFFAGLKAHVEQQKS
ncbi:MAG: SRPBCC family protein [Myxococcales bacterium]|nr:SRPBCC family protein [Myxococcales bacterium]